MIRTNRPLSNCRKIVDVLNFEAEITREAALSNMTRAPGVRRMRSGSGASATGAAENSKVGFSSTALVN